MSGTSIRLIKQELLFGTRGRIDSKYHRDTSRGLPRRRVASAFKLLAQFVEPNAVSHRSFFVQIISTKKHPPKRRVLLFGTRGRIDSKYLRDTSRGFTPPSRCFGVQIVGTISRTNAVSHRLYDTNKNTHLKGGCYCLVPEAGLEPARF